MGTKISDLMRSEIQIEETKKQLHSFTTVISGEKIISNISNLDKFTNLYQKNKKKLNELFPTTLILTVDELKYLSNLYPNKLKRFKIWLCIQKPSEISYQELSEFNNNFNMHAVISNYMMNKYGKFEPHVINYNLYLSYYKKLNYLINHIDFENCYKSIYPQLNIFCKLVNEIITNVQTGNNDETYAYELKNKVKKYETIPDEIIGIINGKCICRGFCGIIRDLCSLANIETKIIKGISKNDGHAWNQVKLDGKWYNIDLTWDYSNLLNNKNAYFFLKSDRDFENLVVVDEANNICCHSDYVYKRIEGNKCNLSVPNELIECYLYSNLKNKSIKENRRIKKLVLQY